MAVGKRMELGENMQIATVSRRVDDFISKVRSGWKEVTEFGGTTFTYFAYRQEEEPLREAYEQLKRDRDFSGLFFKWHGMDDTKSVSFSISLREILTKPQPLIESPRQTFAKKGRRRKSA